MDKKGRPSAHQKYFVAWNRMTGIAPSTEQGWRAFRDYYYNCIQNNDHHLQTLLACMEKHQLLRNTIIILTADHGEMMGAHGLKGKGGFVYENNIHVPLIIYHPAYEGGRRCRNISSHLDLAPTLVDMTTSPSKSNITADLKGHSLMPMVKNPSSDIRNSKGALFAFDMISMIDGNFYADPSNRQFRIDMNKKGFLRGIITSDYKFARYFAPMKFNTPTDYDELYRLNEVEMYAIDSDETDNLAYPKGRNKEIVMDLNTSLNLLIREEIGTDDGRETEAYVGGLANYAKDNNNDNQPLK